MITAAGHTLQLGEQVFFNRESGTRLCRVTLECTCGEIFVSELAVEPTGPQRARIRAAGWAASQLHLKAESEKGKGRKGAEEMSGSSPSAPFPLVSSSTNPS